MAHQIVTVLLPMRTKGVLFPGEERSIRVEGSAPALKQNSLFGKGSGAGKANQTQSLTVRGRDRMRKNSIASLVLAGALGLSMMGCQDTKARQENDQLKARVAELEKENTDLGGKVDALAKENSALASENERLKAAKTPPKKASKGKHHKRSSKRAASGSHSGMEANSLPSGA